MILTVTPNPAIALTHRVSALLPRETYRAAPPAVRAGEKGLTVAAATRAAARLMPPFEVARFDGARGTESGQR